MSEPDKQHKVLLAGGSRDPQGHGHVTHFAHYLEFILDSNSNLHASIPQVHEGFCAMHCNQWPQIATISRIKLAKFEAILVGCATWP